MVGKNLTRRREDAKTLRVLEFVGIGVIYCWLGVVCIGIGIVD